MPAMIELWADPRTGHARRLMLSWNESSRLHVTFDLLNENPRDNAFYIHSAHHGPRQVLRAEITPP